MKYAIIPKMLFETEDLVNLADSGIYFDDGDQAIGTVKVPCYRFYNIDEMQVFDKIYTKLYETSNQQEKTAFANRATAVIFIQLRRVNSIKNPEAKIAAVAALTSSVMALGAIDPRVASRFLSLVRALS